MIYVFLFIVALPAIQCAAAGVPIAASDAELI